MIQNKVDVFILELGGNDGLRGISAESTRKNLQQIIDKVRKKCPRSSILITGMQVPPNLGSEYAQNFKNMYPSLAEENDISLIPLLLDDVGRESTLMQADGIHPTAEGHQLIANKIWDTLKPILKKRTN
jgi:acyl-CoA thioesterase-1